jgi:hypothetical protein
LLENLCKPAVESSTESSKSQTPGADLKNESLRCSVSEITQQPTIKMKCLKTGRILSVHDFYLSFKAEKIISIKEMNREIKYTYCKVTGDTASIKGGVSAEETVTQARCFLNILEKRFCLSMLWLIYRDSAY